MASLPTTIGRYKVLSLLGRGGMGQVLLARDPAIDRLVAIKLLREEFDNPELRERFMREARSAGRLRHVNIVTIFDVGEHDNQRFIAMEYVEGENLSNLISRKAALSVSRKIQVMDELSAALQYAHRAGIIHRDIKSRNIMLDADGVVKVFDFGIARISGSESDTQPGVLLGTLNYMSPEQVMGRPDIDARTDMFSAGLVFYELLAYRQAFPGGLDTGILNKIISDGPEPLLSIDPASTQGSSPS
jgi:serine/threonine protein kinase